MLAVTPGLQRSLNDVAFENYHVFRAEAKVLTESEAANWRANPPPTPNGNGSKQAEETNTSSLAATTQVTSLPQSSSQAESSVSAAADSSNPPAPESQPAPQAASNTTNSAPAPTPVATPPASNLPPPPAPENTASSANIPVFRTTARQVLVDVVVDKKNGDPVPDLPKSDFSVNENGKPQTIDFGPHRAQFGSVQWDAARPRLGLFSDCLFLLPLQFLIVFILQLDLDHLLALIDLRVNANFGHPIGGSGLDEMLAQ